jgi:hypothetical protein
MWTEEEDEELRALVAEYGQKKWAFICTKMSTGKGAKQCRRRWSNYLNNDLKQGGWSPEEDEILWNGHKQHGNKWTEIAKMVGGRTDNAVKNRHAVLVKKEEDRLAGGGAGESSGKRKRRDATTDPSSSQGGGERKRAAKAGTASGGSQHTRGLPGSAVTFPGTATTVANAADVAGWRPNLNLSVKIPSSSAEERGESNLPSAMTGGTSAPPSLEGLPTSASLTAAEIELLKQVQELISPHAEGLTLPAGGTARSGGRGTFAMPPPQPHSPLDTPTVDLQQVMNWIMSVTPRAGANGGGNAGAGAGAGRATRASANAANAAETPQGQHSVLLRKLLTEKLTGSPTGEAGRRRSPRSAGGEGGGDKKEKETHVASHTPVGMDLANAGGLMGGLPASLPVSPNFTSSELNLLMNALGGGGDTPTSGLMGGINPFGRASDSTDATGSGSKR